MGVQHVPREHNTQVNILSKLVSTKKKGRNKSVIQEILPRPSIEKSSLILEVYAFSYINCWMTLIYNYLIKGELPSDQKEASMVRRRTCSYVLAEEKIYKKGFLIPLLKCIKEGKVAHILHEIHERISTQHLGGRYLARKSLQAE